MLARYSVYIGCPHALSKFLLILVGILEGKLYLICCRCSLYISIYNRYKITSHSKASYMLITERKVYVIIVSSMDVLGKISHIVVYMNL